MLQTITVSQAVGIVLLVLIAVAAIMVTIESMANPEHKDNVHLKPNQHIRSSNFQRLIQQRSDVVAEHHTIVMSIPDGAYTDNVFKQFYSIDCLNCDARLHLVFMRGEWTECRSCGFSYQIQEAKPDHRMILVTVETGEGLE